MATLVQKYGGTSVADLDRIRAVARRVATARQRVDRLAVVVSARAGVTNRLINDARQLHPQPSPREMDTLLAVGEQETIALLAIALHALDVPAVSLTGGQAGFITTDAHTRARILKVDGDELEKHLSEGKVVIVAGFQGRNPSGQVTTLGRGGSDLSAIALASCLGADRCEILTDVDGVYTADPRVVPDAAKLTEISYDEMLELASLGSKVMQARAVEFAKKHGVEFVVRSSFNEEPGTIVKEEIASMEDVVVRGVAVDKNQVKIVVSELSDKPGTAAQVFSDLGHENINVDMIVQNIGRNGRANLTFTVSTDDAYRAEQCVAATLARQGVGQVTTSDRIAKVSVVGVGMRSHTGVAAALFTALATTGVNIQLISTSEIKISVAIDLDKADEAARAAHAAFALGKLPAS